VPQRAVLKLIDGIIVDMLLKLSLALVVTRFVPDTKGALMAEVLGAIAVVGPIRQVQLRARGAGVGSALRCVTTTHPQAEDGMRNRPTAI